MRNYTIIGLTGPTGAGKSTVTKYLKSKGCYIIDADVLGKQALEKGSDCLKQVCAVFGNDILNSNGELIRPLLAKKAFATPKYTEKLNSITHPWICMQTLKQINSIRNAQKNPVIIIDAAVLLESCMDIICDYIVAVVAPPQIRKQRIIARDNLTEEQAVMRMSAQKDNCFYIEKADFVIDSYNDIDSVYRKADDVLAVISGGKL